MKTALLPMPRGEVRCAFPVALYFLCQGERRGHLSPGPGLLGCGGLRASRNCRRGSWRLSRVGFGGNGYVRSPPRGRRLPVGCWQTRRVCPHPAVVVWGKVISWSWWPEYRRRNRRVGQQAVFAVVIGPLRLCLPGWDISVDSLAAHLIVNRRLPHGATP